MPMILFHSSRPSSRNGVLPPTPALLMRMSMPPNASRVDPTMADTDVGSATLTVIGTARPPCCLRPAAASSAPSRLISAMATAAPSRTKVLAIASPMPRAPPVITATLPSTRIAVPPQYRGRAVLSVRSAALARLGQLHQQDHDVIAWRHHHDGYAAWCWHGQEADPDLSETRRCDDTWD